MGEPTRLPNFEQISVTAQEDSFSCGILSTNSLLHHLLPHNSPRVLRDKISIKMYQIGCTVEILKLSVEIVRTFPDHHVHTLTPRAFQSGDRDVQEFSPTIPPSWPPAPSCSRPSSPPSSPTPWSSSPPLFSSPPPIHMNSKHRRTEDNKVREQPPSKQQKISKFFTKLTRTEGIEQVTRSFVQSVDAVIAVYFSTYFSPFLSNFTPSFFYFTHS